MRNGYIIPAVLSTNIILESELLAGSGLNASITYKAGSEELTYEGFDFVTDNWD